MSNQAQSIANDLMVGAGALYFLRDDDNNKSLHHLGNCDEFNITTDVTTVEKNSSMNKRRELMASVVTAVSPSATLTLTEYNPYNMALGLFGTENVHNQVAKTFTEGYTVNSVPGVLEIVDANGERYFNLENVTIGLTTPTPASFAWTSVSGDYAISTVTATNDTITDNHAVAVPASFKFDASAISSTDYTVTDTMLTDVAGGGKVLLDVSGMTGTASMNVEVEVTTAPTAAGDLDGMEISVTEDGGTPTDYTVSSTATSYDVTLSNGCKMTFTVGTTDTFTVVSTGFEANAVPAGTGSAGGTIQLKTGTFSGTEDSNVYVNITSGTTAAGDLAGLQFTVIEGGLGAPQSFTATGGSMTQVFTLASGATMTFTVTATTFIAASGGMIEAELKAAASEFVAGKDYIIDEQMLRGGIIQIPANSAIKAGDVVMVTATVPEGAFVTVSGSSAGEIGGKLLFVGDPNIGGQYIIEAWKVRVQPEGDFAGLISSDFGTFNLTIRFLADYENHPAYPYYKATMVGRADGQSKTSGVYDPNY